MKRVRKVNEASVIIAHDKARGAALLRRCTSSIKKASDVSWAYGKIITEIIVATEGSKTESRNNAAKKAKFDILVFVDDDVVVTDSWLHELLRHFGPGVGAVGGPNVLVPGSEYKEFLADLLMTSLMATGKSSSRYAPKGEVRETDESELQSCNLAIRKEAFERVGGFPDIIPCEENALLNSIQLAGYKLLYTPLAIVYHNRPKLFMPYARKMFFYGTGRGKLMRARKGGVRFANFRPKTAVYFVAGLFVHYVCYISGLIWGLIKG